MAAFRFKLEMVPRSFLGEKPMEAINMELLQEGIEPWTAARQPSQRSIDRLQKLLPKNTSWGKTEEFVSNSEWGSKLRIWHHDDGLISNIEFGYSALSGDWHLMQAFASIAQADNCLLVDCTTGAIVEPNEEQVKAHFTTSNAALFVVDPNEAMRRASANIRMPKFVEDEEKE